jgi:hypothetical protein
MQVVRAGKNITITLGWSPRKPIDWSAMYKTYYEKVPDIALGAGLVIGGLSGAIFGSVGAADSVPQAMVFTPLFGYAGAMGGGIVGYGAAYIAPPILPLCVTGAAVYYMKTKWEEKKKKNKKNNGSHYDLNGEAQPSG